MELVKLGEIFFFPGPQNLKTCFITLNAGINANHDLFYFDKIYSKREFSYCEAEAVTSPVPLKQTEAF